MTALDPHGDHAYWGLTHVEAARYHVRLAEYRCRRAARYAEQAQRYADSATRWVRLVFIGVAISAGLVVLAVVAELVAS